MFILNTKMDLSFFQATKNFIFRESFREELESMIKINMSLKPVNDLIVNRTGPV